MFYVCNIDSDADKQEDDEDEFVFKDDSTLQEAEERLRQEDTPAAYAEDADQLAD